MTGRDYAGEARLRWAMCIAIAEHANALGLNATPRKVNKNFTIWRTWKEGRLATGYLMKLTGAKYVTRKG
jgi:hypothetical protein